ncbi:MAG: hypothetical protein AB7I59_15165 [Geminicoccaceae bacterium]
MAGKWLPAPLIPVPVDPRPELRYPRHKSEGASPEELGEIVHEALEAMPDDRQALAPCADWAEITFQLEDLLSELTNRMAAEAEVGRE